MTSAILTKEQVESNPGTKIVSDWFKQTYGVDLPVKETLSDRERDSLDKRNQLIPDAWKAPCKTCGKHYGFQDDVPPYYIWCINNKCEAYHGVFTPVEWQNKGFFGKKRQHD